LASRRSPPAHGSARPVCSTLLLHSASGHWQCPLAACALIGIWAGHTGQRVTLPAQAECDSPVSGSVRALCTRLLARGEKGTPFSAKQAGRLLPLWQRTSLPGARVRQLRAHWPSDRRLIMRALPLPSPAEPAAWSLGPSRDRGPGSPRGDPWLQPECTLSGFGREINPAGPFAPAGEQDPRCAGEQQ
jgi:hypothetical protein